MTAAMIVAPPVEGARPVSPQETKHLLTTGLAPAGLQIKGRLKLTDADCTGRNLALPVGLRAECLDLSDCSRLTWLPDDMQVGRLNLSGCHNLRRLPANLRCYELNLSGASITALPADLKVDFRLDLSDCTALETLPAGLKVGSLILRECTALETLPEGLDVAFLDISGCVGLREWPQQARVQVGRLNLRGCYQLTALPAWLTDLAQLDLAGCDNITELPAGLKVRSWLDIAGTGILSLPAGMEPVQLRWRGVAIDHRVAFAPETITAREVMDTPNVELRRILMERMGYENFMREVRSETLDMDRDPGGPRLLLRVPLGRDEPLVCLSVTCPSTGRNYMLRVPPEMRTCRQAAAWLAGFDSEKDYRPLQET
jgi:hypothetical protein